MAVPAVRLLDAAASVRANGGSQHQCLSFLELFVQLIAGGICNEQGEYASDVSALVVKQFTVTQL
jgi:hypothetical protein